MVGTVGYIGFDSGMVYLHLFFLQCGFCWLDHVLYSLPPLFFVGIGDRSWGILAGYVSIL